MSESRLRVLVLGASGGSGRAAVEGLLAAGYEVTAFSRREIGLRAERLSFAQGDAMDPRDVARTVLGHDAVVVALGIRENPIRVRLVGPARTPMHVRSSGTRHVIAAMQRHGVRKLVVQSSYGVGETRDRLGLVNRLFFSLLLKPQIVDTEQQERLVRESGLDWVLVQPVHLTDGLDDARPAVSTKGETERMSVSRRSVGRFMAEAVASRDFIGQSVAVSGPK